MTLISFNFVFTQFYAEALASWWLHLKPPTSILKPEQSDVHNLISSHMLDLSFLIPSLLYLPIYVFWHFLMHKFISLLVHATLIHVALNQSSTSINSLGKYSQLLILFSASDIALLENEHSDPQKKTLKYKTCNYDGIFSTSKTFFWLSMNIRSSITEHLSASSCLRARLEGTVPEIMATLSKISSLAGDEKLYGSIIAPAPLSPVLIKMLVKRRIAAEWAIYDADKC